MSIFLRLNALPCIQVNIRPHLLGNSKHLTRSPQRAYAVRFPRVGTATEKEGAYRLKDNVPAGYALIYRAPMVNYVASAKHGSTITILLFAGLYGWNYLVNRFNPKAALYPRPESSLDKFVKDEGDIWFFIAGFVAINVVIRIFVATFPLRIYKNLQKYIAVYDSQISWKTMQSHYFRQGEVVPVPHVLNPWSHLTYRLGTRSSLLLEDYFKTPAEFHEMCGLEGRKE